MSSSSRRVFSCWDRSSCSKPRKAKLQMDIVDEQIDVTTRAFLGLTVSCAAATTQVRPIPTRDYYALAASSPARHARE